MNLHAHADASIHHVALAATATKHKTQQTLGIPKSDLQIMQGSKSRDKTVGVSTVGLRAKSRGRQQEQVGDEDLVASIRELLLRGT